MFGEMRGTARSAQEVDRVIGLLAEGLSDYEVARRIGIPRSTVLNWRRGSIPKTPAAVGPFCTVCGTPEHDLAELPGSEYSYLLGQYLGDGTICRVGKSLCLRIASDAGYTDIIRECCDAIAAVRGRFPNVRLHSDTRLATIASYWRAWPCLIPQHGPGRKHRRTIALAPWQVSIVEAYPGPFLRGLIHSDGWRGVNRVHVKGRDYEYPRYQFSNRSDDIRQLFVYGCELLGIAWRPWGRYHISVARRDSVALLDQFVGLKS
jgi:transcriptional regulator with XRE-family HTH domain